MNKVITQKKYHITSEKDNNSKSDIKSESISTLIQKEKTLPRMNYSHFTKPTPTKKSKPKTRGDCPLLPSCRIEVMDMSTEFSTSNKIENFIQQNSPVNNNLIRNESLNDLLHTDIDGNISVTPTEVISRAKQGKTTQVITKCSCSYVEDLDPTLFQLKGANKITAYDLRVYNTVCTLYYNGKTTVSLNTIFSVMTGYKNNNPNKNQIATIERCLKKLSNINMYIDITDEVNSNLIPDKKPLLDAGILKNNKDKTKKVTIESKMLSYAVGTIESENGRIFKSIKILVEPTLLTYNRAKKTLITIPIEYIGFTNSNAVERNIALQDYLLIRIMGFKSGKMRENKILYSTLYRDSGVGAPKDRSNRKRDRTTIKKMFSEWVAAGLLASFAETKKGNAIDGITFEVANLSTT